MTVHHPIIRRTCIDTILTIILFGSCEEQADVNDQVFQEVEGAKAREEQHNHLGHERKEQREKFEIFRN